MKPISAITLTLLLSTGGVFAGQEVADTKETKQVVTEEPLFKDHEFQTGTFAIYNVGNGPPHAGVFREHSWGEGSELNYFFCKYVGIGAEYSGFYGHESPDTN